MANDFGTTSTTSTSGTSSSVKDSVEKLADQGGETINVLKDRASAMADQLKQQYSSALNRSMDFIQQRPLASIGIALGLGYFSRTIMRLGMLIGAGALATQVLGPKLSARMDRRRAAVE